MKRGWIAVALVAAMLCLAGWHTWTLGELTGELEATLERSEAMAEEGDWSGAEELTCQAREKWDAQDLHLHVTLDHAVVDEIDASFAETLEFLRCREEGEYSAANARLRTQLKLLGEMERPVLENLL